MRPILTSLLAIGALAFIAVPALPHGDEDHHAATSEVAPSTQIEGSSEDEAQQTILSTASAPSVQAATSPRPAGILAILKALHPARFIFQSPCSWLLPLPKCS